MIARIVLRNSTDKQAKAGTIRAQRTPVRELATRCGATSFVEYVEEGVSGAAPLDERDVMRRLLTEAKPGDIVCAFDLSRLTRAEKILQRYAVLGQLEAAQVRLLTVEDGEIDFDDMGSRITMHVRGEIASEERKKIKRNFTSGKENAAKEGRKPQGATPYGWSYDRGTRKWSLVEPQASIRRELIQRIINRESTGKIAEDFNRRRVPYPARKGRKGRKDAQPGWTARRVWHFAVQPINKGEWTWNGHMIAVPPLVNADTFAQVQVALSKNQERGRRRTQHVYLLDEGHGRCALCEAPLKIQWGGKEGQIAYYVCARRLDEGECELPWWRVDEADGIVWNECTKILEQPHLVEEMLRERVADQHVDGSLAKKDVEKGEKRLKQLADAKAMFMRQASKGHVTEEELDRELSNIAREAKIIGQTVAAAREQADKARAVVTEIGSVRSWLNRVKREVYKASAEKRRLICRGLAPKVELDETKVRIGFRLREPQTQQAGSTCS